MYISRKHRYILSLLIPLGMLSSCSYRKRNAVELRKHGNNQIGAGSALAATSVGTLATLGSISSSSLPVDFWVIGWPGICFLSCVMAPVAGVLIAKGIKNRKKAKKKLRLEQQAHIINNREENYEYCAP